MTWYDDVMKHFSCRGFYPSGWLNLSETSGDTKATWMQTCSVCQERMKVTADTVAYVCAFALVHTHAQVPIKCVCDSSVMCSSIWMNTKGRDKKCPWLFSEWLPWQRGTFPALKVKALSIQKLSWMWNFRQTLYEYTKSVSHSWSMKQLQAVSACHHRLESQFFGFLTKELLMTALWKTLDITLCTSFPKSQSLQA